MEEKDIFDVTTLKYDEKGLIPAVVQDADTTVYKIYE